MTELGNELQQVLSGKAVDNPNNVAQKFRQFLEVSESYDLRDLTFIIGGGRVEIEKKVEFFCRPSTLESQFFIDPLPKSKKIS